MAAVDRAMIAAAVLSCGRGCCTHPDHVHPASYAVDGSWSAEHWLDGAIGASAEVQRDRIIVSYSQDDVQWRFTLDIVGPWPYNIGYSPVYPQDPPGDTSAWEMLETGDTADTGATP